MNIVVIWLLFICKLGLIAFYRQFHVIKIFAIATDFEYQPSHKYHDSAELDLHWCNNMSEILSVYLMSNTNTHFF